jgi:hypothetical protein
MSTDKRTGYGVQSRELRIVLTATLNQTVLISSDGVIV